MKSYSELSREERLITFENYQQLCREDDSYTAFDSFEEYDDEQMFIDMDFDAETLECLG